MHHLWRELLNKANSLVRTVLAIALGYSYAFSPHHLGESTWIGPFCFGKIISDKAETPGPLYFGENAWIPDLFTFGT